MYKETDVNSRPAHADVGQVPADLATNHGHPPDSSPDPEVSSGQTAPEPDPRIASLAALFQSAGEGNLLLDAEGRIVYSGGVAHWFIGCKREELLQQSFLDLVPPDQRAFVAGAIDRVRSGATEPLFETHWTDVSTGRLTVIALQIAALIEEGRVLGITVKGFELATRHSADAAARGDLDASRQLAERSPLVIFHLDARGQCTFLNARWTILTGQPRAQSLGTGWLNQLPESDRMGFRSMAAAAHRERRGWRHHFHVVNAVGGAQLVDGAAMPLLDAGGAPIGYFGSIALVSTAIEALSPSATEATVPTSAQKAEPAQEAEPAPIVPARIEKHALPAIPLNSAPTLDAGFTSADLLLGTRRIEDPIPVEASVTEPGIDKLTGLANRLLFAQHVEATISRMGSDALTVSLSFVDLHGLTKEREANGPRVANDYLFLLAKRLEATIRSIEIAGRISGDVLGVLSINWLFPDDLPIVAHRLLDRLGEPLATKDGSEVSVAMRLGMAVAKANEGVEDLFSRTWNAMAAAKDSPDRYEINLG